ncbi:MAG: universal stress protein [Chthoniobacterales bacterium]
MKSDTMAAKPQHNGAHHLRVANILVPIDFSAMSIAAISTAKRLAQRFGATIHLAHIQEYTYPAALLGPGAPVLVAPMLDFEQWRKAAEERLENLAKDHGLRGTCRAEIAGAPFDMLCAIADQIPADLIVTSTHGRTGLERVLLGSTAERLVQHSPCPVFVARESKKGAATRHIDKILVPVDFSDCSLGGLRYAIEFAKKFAARIVVLHVANLGPALMTEGYGSFDVDYYRDIARRNSEEEMRQFLRGVKFGAVPFETAIIAQFSTDGICGAAEEEKADLIIMATHGRAGLTHVLIGSTAEAVVRHAPCPVLVVPSHPEVRAANVMKSPALAQRHPWLPKPVRKEIPETLTTRHARKLVAHPFPERRQINKFRETHVAARS